MATRLWRGGPGDDTTPVLVLASRSHTALGVIRSLGQWGLPVFTAGGAGFVASSRWYRIAVPGKEPQAPSLAAYLRDIPAERMVVVPCSDAWVDAVARLEPSIAARFPASQPPRDTIDVCLDKLRLAETLSRLGIPHPATFRIDETDDIRRLWTEGVQHPFLKPRRSQEFQQRFGRKAVAARSAGEAGRWVQEARGAGMELVVQDYVPGPARAHYFIDGFVDRTGTMRARMARRRLRTYPEPFGDSSSMETIPLGDVDPMVHALDRLLPALNYRGVFNAQFKRDDRDGVFKLLDLNCRPWGGIALATACGVHLPVMCYRDALELDVETVREYPVGTRWVYQPRDLLACCGLWRAGVREPARWLRTWSGAVHPIWSRHDPRPAIAFAVEETARLAAGRSRTGRSPWPSSGDNRDGDERDGHGEKTR